MKKVYSFLLIATVFVMFTACGGGGTKTEGGNTEAEVHADGDQTDGEAAAGLADGTYTINAETSTAKWIGEKMTPTGKANHFGMIPMTKGEMTVAGGNLTAGAFAFDASKLTVDDIEDAEYNAKLTGHLNSTDFFNTAEYPEVMFTVTGVEATEGEFTHNITGDLTIKGITNSITFPAKVMATDSGMEAVGTATFDRTKFDIKFKSKVLPEFMDVTDDFIYDDVMLELNIKADKSAA